MDNKQIAAVEVCSDEGGNVLWIAPYILARAHRIGDTFIENYITYRVVDVEITRGRLGSVMVEHVVRKEKQ